MKNKICSTFIFCLFIFFSTDSLLFAQERKIPFWEMESPWVDSVFNALSPDERLGQLFMVAAFSNKDTRHVRDVRELIQKYNLGGLIFMQGGPGRQAKLTNYYQKLAKVPLMIAIDGEWGLAMRLDSVPQYPRQMTMGAIQDDSLIYEVGRQIARECKRMGIHVNFGPVADVNNNPSNPVISVRSFGENKQEVALRAYRYMAGMQDEGVLANGKHFPGHGDTDMDSHLALPQILHSAERLDSLELYPFKYLFERNLGSVMVAHLNIPAYDTTSNQASTLSKYVVTSLLKDKLAYKGLIFTDALNMKGASKYNAPGVVDAKALVAGNDVLLYSENVGKAITEIKASIERGEITWDEINLRVKKILKAKYWCGLDKKQFVKTKHLYEDLNSKSSDLLNTRLAESAVTVLKNENQILPLRTEYGRKVLEISIGTRDSNLFAEYLGRYLEFKHIGISHDGDSLLYDSIQTLSKGYDLVIIQVNRTNNKPDQNFGLKPHALRLITNVCREKPSILVSFSNPYWLNKLEDIGAISGLIQAYEYNRFTQKAAAEVLVGALQSSGKLPVSVAGFKRSHGIDLQHCIRIQEVNPALLGISERQLKEVDSLAIRGIRESNYPGCQVLAMKNGKVFYHKSFGKTTYEGKENVTNHHLYDLASVTKVAATALMVMKMTGNKQFDISKTLEFYLPDLKGTDKGRILLSDMLTHQAGLAPWLPFYLKTITKDYQLKSDYYRAEPSDTFGIKVAENVYILSSIKDSIYQQILSSPLNGKKEYVYSDLGYYYLKKIIEQYYKLPLDEVLEREIYGPMGLHSLCFNPWKSGELKNIVPTENDKNFRKQVLRAYVHDQGAAMLGGVAGHAGLFGNAWDLGALMYMLQSKGAYAGKQMLDSATVRVFTQSCLNCPQNRRGLCFEKPEMNPKKESPVTKECSASSFGHSGFTGTFVWADPVNGLVYVFLSNRVYPDAEKNKLAKSGLRGKIHKVFYDALKYAEKP